MVKQITVCLATYQGAPWLPAQLESLQAQDDPGFMVLMQDDGSKDDTVSLLLERAASDARFRMASESGRHFGAAGNFISMMRQVHTPYTALCDQDDVWQTNRLSACRAAMAQAEETYGEATPILVHSDSRVLNEDGTERHASFFAHQGWDGHANTLNRLLVQNNVTGCTVLMNEALRKLVCSYAKPEKLFMHDWFLAQTAAAFGKVVFVPRALVGYRQHGTNVIGASQTNQIRRGMAALSMRDKAQKRMALNYQQARALSACYGDQLPAEAQQTLDAFLKTENEPKAARILHLVQGGYLMQSPVTRAGQLIFG